MTNAGPTRVCTQSRPLTPDAKSDLEQSARLVKTSVSIINQASPSWVCCLKTKRDLADAIAACGYPETRKVFYPPLNLHDTVSANSYREYFLKYDFKVSIRSIAATVTSTDNVRQIQQFLYKWRA